MISTLIVEDEMNIAYKLKSCLRKWAEIQLLGEAESAEEAMTLIQDKKPDLLLLDIGLKGEKSGIDILEWLNEKRIEVGVIFVTAHTEYAPEIINKVCYDKHHRFVGFIHKPIEEAMLKNRIQQFLSTQYTCFTQIESDCKVVKTICFNDILYCESDGAYTTIYLSDEKSLYVSENLKLIESRLPISYFFRTGRSHIVAINKVSHVIPQKGIAVLKVKHHEIEIPLGETEAKHLKKELEDCQFK